LVFVVDAQCEMFQHFEMYFFHGDVVVMSLNYILIVKAKYEYRKAINIWK